MPEPIYDESTIKSLDWKEHIRTRPGMYIGKLGDGSSHDDGIYILLKEIVIYRYHHHEMSHPLISRYTYPVWFGYAPSSPAILL
jgi:topoisomerase-4 subunit B